MLCRFHFRLFSFALCLVLLTACGCTPRQEVASARSLYIGGRADFNISVTDAMRLAAASRFSGFVPSDVTVQPSGRFRYALFSDSLEGPVQRQAHVILGELPREQWLWEKETWAMPESLSYEKTRMAGKFWTVQMFPVFSSQDWFAHLWQVNGRSTPDFWIAKRWSATPETYMRIVAEYREPAPLCMKERLASAAQSTGQANAPFKGKELWRNCDNEIQDFSARADAAFLFDKAGVMPEAESAPFTAMPPGKPDTGKLVGKAEHADTFTRTGGE